MKRSLRHILVVLSVMLSLYGVSQNENKKWYFGQNAGLDFMTATPSVLTGSLVTQEGCASVANSAGTLLFYTDGSTIYTTTHTIMANGTGLNGNASTTQSGVIVKQPGNTNIYYVFSLNAGGNATLCYSIIDMSMSSGSGSVTVKNVTLAPSCTEKLTSVKHCNGVDVWVMTRNSTGSYLAFLVTSAGVGTTPVSTTIGTTNMPVGYLKFSPNGTRLAAALYNANGVELYDFNASTGVVSNSLSLPALSMYGCEFSPDGTKLYASGSSRIVQWDLCAGSSTAIVASQYTTAASSNWAMQLATDGKIYVSRLTQTVIGVVNSPNSSGSACNYVDLALSISPNLGRLGLPNFITSGFKPPPPPFTHTVNMAYGCQTASFTAPSAYQNFTTVSCSASGYSLMGIMWNFGDPASGSANTSTLTNPSHAFTTLGTYTTSLILYYSCGGGTDTIKGVVNIQQPCLTVTSASITCSSLGSATVTNQGIGPYSYTWIPTNQTGSVATGLSPGTYTIKVFDFGNNYTYSTTVNFVSLIPLSGSLGNSQSVTCNGAATGSAAYTGISGGSGSQTYSWTNGVSSYAVANPTTLSAGVWSVTVTDALTNCTMSNVFFINQPPPMTLNIAPSSPTACIGATIVLTGINSGGSPGYTYSWTPGPASNTLNVVKFSAGTYIYTLTSKDSYSCFTSNTVSVDYLGTPTIVVTNTSVCPQQTGILTAFGAITYTWSTAATTPTMSANPNASTQYTVIGSTFGCTASATGSITVKPVPAINFSSNSPVCNGQSLTFGVTGVAGAAWTGPALFASATAGNAISNASPNNSGAYTVTVTAANTCTNTGSFTLTVNPTPSLVAAGATVCVGQALMLGSSSVPGASYSWSGPNMFSASVQNPAITMPQTNATGQYVVSVTSTAGCVNTVSVNALVASPPFVMLLNDSPRCFGTALSLTGNNIAGGPSYSWIGPNNFTSPLQSPVIANTSMAAAGIYTLTVVAGPCVVSKTTAVIINALPTPTVQSNSPVCELKALKFFAGTPSNNITSFNWLGPAGFNSMVQAPVRDSSSLVHAGAYTVMVTDNNNCQASAVITVSVLSNPTLSAVSATVCLYEPARLQASGAATYAWYYLGVGISAQQVALITKASNPVNSPAIYQVAGTAVNGCTAIATASVSTLKLPTPSIVVEPAARQCMGGTFSFIAEGAKLYAWEGPVNTAYNGQTLTVKAGNMAQAGTYSLIAIDGNGCRGGATANIVIDPLPEGSLWGNNMEGCVPFCSDFNFRPAANANILPERYWRIGTSGFVKDTFSLCFKKPGDYVLQGRVTDKQGCSNTFSAGIIARPVPAAAFSFYPDKPVESLDEVQFTDLSEGERLTNFNWYFANNKTTSAGKHAAFTFGEAGIYPVALMVTNEWGCTDSLVKNIIVEPDFYLFVPNAFTPNSDTKNEAFMPVLRSVKLYHFKVFNRWGQLLFETNDPAQGWNGSYNGEACKVDTYVWQLSLSTLKGEMKEYKGHVTLLK